MDVGRLRFWTVTAPGKVADVEEWNAGFAERWKLTYRGLKRVMESYGISCAVSSDTDGTGTQVGAQESGGRLMSMAYYGVKEFQQRGLLHGHFLIRQVGTEWLPMRALGKGGDLAGLLEAQGFGPVHWWQAVAAEKGGAIGAAAYLSKYLLKSVHDERFPKGSHVDLWSRDWPLKWSQHVPGRMTVMKRRDGSGSVERWQFAGSSRRAEAYVKLFSEPVEPL